MVNWLAASRLQLTQNQRNAVRKRCRGRASAFDRFEWVRRRPQKFAGKQTLMLAGNRLNRLSVIMLAF